MRSLPTPIAVLLASSLASACIYRRAEAEVKWSYSGVDGPLMWHKLSPDFAACGNGKNQSPINIDPTVQVARDGVADLAGYPRSATFNITNNGHTIQAVPAPAPNASAGAPPILVMLGGEPHRLVNFHFHASSEHLVDRQGYPLEAHFVHSHVKTGALAVVGVLVDVESGGSGCFFGDIPFDSLLDKGDNVLVESTILQEIAVSVRRVYTYSGSLTTPPCTEQVSWFVSESPITIPAEQFTHLKRATGFNSRYTQGGRGEQNLLQQQCGA